MPPQIRYELPDPAYEAYTWVLQDEHGAGAQPPLYWDRSIFGPMPRPAPGEVPIQVLVHGFPYARPEASGRNPFGRAEAPRTVADLVSWRQEWLPQVEAYAESLDAFDPAAVPPGAWKTTLNAQEREAGGLFVGVHLNTVVNGYQAVEHFTDAYVARFGEESRPESFALLQGFPNLSLERAIALWDLSRIAREDPSLLAAVAEGESLPVSANAARFRDLFDAALARFGSTTNIGGGHLPVWAEEPLIPLSIIRAYARLPDDRGPRASAEQQRQGRIALETRVRGLQDSGNLVALMEMAQQYLPNLEDHNLLCDQRISAAFRARWLRIGASMAPRGLSATDDVFYYRRAELVSALEGGPLLDGGVLVERRAVQEAVGRWPPPPILGKPIEDSAAAARAMEPLAAGRRISGIAASPGLFTGRARIIETLDDASRLEDGDVLVCRATTPPWSPLFATIGALVVNTGGMLSHGAVVAREFGIPAVVGTMYGTTLIPDGSTVTVDGTQGLVIVEGA